MKRQFAAALVALMLVTAGCSFGGTGPGDSGEPSDGTSVDAVGTINFYISDQPGAIEDFEHLNVTISQVEFRTAGSEDEETDEDEPSPTNNTATTSAGGTDAEEGDDEEMDDEMDDGGVQRFDIDDRTVDLTRLKGENATLLEEFEVENGTYTQVRISVSDINGTLTDGSSAEVKLPSEKLRINQRFVVGNNESVDFVYDINVVKRGNSGAYNIKPVAGQSGTDVPINRVDDGEEMDEEGEETDEGDETSPTPTPTGDESMSGDEQGRMNFYVSDQQNAIDDFRYLNVTISEVSLRGPAADGSNTAYAVDGRSVDLTALQGDNATLVETFDVPAGNYTKVFISVSDINGTLTDGSSADVKLPSDRLRLNEGFEVGAGESVDFVYDITVVKRGQSGSYNIQPVAGESGTEVPIDRVDDGDTATGNGTTEAPALAAEFVDDVTAGENATVSVTRNGTAVENATVSYDGTDYATDADGTVTFEVPSDAETVEVEVTDGEGTVTLTESLDSEGSADDGQAASSGGGSADTSTGTATATAAD